MTTPNPFEPGAIASGALTGTELVDVNVGPVWVSATTQQIANLASSSNAQNAVTAVNTVGNATLTAANMNKRIIQRGGAQSGTPFTDTTDTATAIIATFASATVGDSYKLTYQNLTNAVATLAGGTGVTFTPASPTIQPNGWAEILVAIASATTVTAKVYEYGEMVADAADSTKQIAFNASGQTTGTVATLATANTAAATYTFPAATDTLVGRASTDTLTNKTLTSPTLTTPALGTPASGVLTNCTGLPMTTGVTGLLAGTNGGTGVNNGTNTITLAGNLTTTGAFNTTFAQGASTTQTLPSVSSTLSAIAIAPTAAGATLAVTAAMSNSAILLNTASGSVATLPAATGTGNKYRFIVTTSTTSGAHKILAASSSDNLIGIAVGENSNTAKVFASASGTGNHSIQMPFTGSQPSGGIQGDWFEFEDVATNLWAVRAAYQAGTTPTTPFSTATS